ncbi:MAG: DUF2975 domain-containing protein [Ruminiclostridium sp.]|nr:DUF2975 domain-containing protein [Ruminiclostridium sp.]
MEKVVNTIEKTLEKDKKKFIFVCKIAEVFSIVALAIFIVAIIAIAIMAVMSVTGVADAVKEFGSPKAIMTMITDTLMLITFIIALNFSTKIFNKLKTGETPFQYDIANKIKGAGIALITGTFVCSILEFVTGFLLSSGIIADTESYESIVSTNYAVFGVVLVALAYVFNYGCKLQQESDETV